MSAVNILPTPTGAAIFTDAAMYDASGIVVALHTKCHTFARGRLAITGRGNALFPIALAEHFASADIDIDVVEADGGEFIERCHARAEGAMLEAAGKALNDIFIVGWSETAGAAKIAQWSNCPPTGVPRFSIVNSVMAPDLSPAGYERVRSVVAGRSQADMPVAEIGLAVMRSQRLDTGSAKFAAAGQYLVGGHVLQTDVTATGITQHIIHEWPEDRIGERIRPTPQLEATSAPNVVAIGSTGRASAALDAAAAKRARKAAKLARALA